jgi:hypothetical protein
LPFTFGAGGKNDDRWRGAAGSGVTRDIGLSVNNPATGERVPVPAFAPVPVLAAVAALAPAGAFGPMPAVAPVNVDRTDWIAFGAAE